MRSFFCELVQSSLHSSHPLIHHLVLTGTTPRQYLLRMRLRKAAGRLKQDSARIVDIAFDCGFGDVSNFNRAFKAEFGFSPRTYRST